MQLNVVKSIRLILDAMTDVQAAQALSSSSSRPSSPSPNDLPTLSPELLRLKMRLLPLQQVEEALLKKLNPNGAYDIEATTLSTVTNNPTRNKELAVHSSSPWKGAFTRLLTGRPSTDGKDTEIDFDFDNPNDPGVILHACSEDMIRLWEDPTVKRLLKAQRIRLEDLAGL